MRAIVMGLAAALMATGAAFANDQPINPTVTLENLDRAFELAAGELDTMTTIYSPICSEGPPASCSFQGFGPLEIHGIAESLDAPPSNISLYWQPTEEKKAMDAFVLNVGLLVSVAEPDMDQEQRGQLIADLLATAAGEKDNSIVEGSNADFTATKIGNTVIIVTEKAGR